MTEFEFKMTVAAGLLFLVALGLAVWIVWEWLLGRPKVVAAAAATAKEAGKNEALTTAAEGCSVAPGDRADITPVDLKNLKEKHKTALRGEKLKHAKTYEENQRWRALDWTRDRWPWKQFNEGARQVLEFYCDRLKHDTREDARKAVARMEKMLERIHPPHERRTRRSVRTNCYVSLAVSKKG